jgi:hypothetical protein
VEIDTRDNFNFQPVFGCFSIPYGKLGVKEVGQIISDKKYRALIG